MARVVDDFDFNMKKPMNPEWFNGHTWELSAEDFIVSDSVPKDLDYFLKMKARVLKTMLQKKNDDGTPIYPFNKLQTRIVKGKLYIKAINI